MCVFSPSISQARLIAAAQLSPDGALDSISTSLSMPALALEVLALTVLALTVLPAVLAAALALAAAAALAWAVVVLAATAAVVVAVVVVVAAAVVVVVVAVVVDAPVVLSAALESIPAWAPVPVAGAPPVPSSVRTGFVNLTSAPQRRETTATLCSWLSFATEPAQYNTDSRFCYMYVYTHVSGFARHPG